MGNRHLVGFSVLWQWAFWPWLPFSEAILGLLVGLLVQCEGNYSFLYVVSLLMYFYAAPGVFGYPE